MLTNYNYYVLNAVTLSAFTLGSSLCISASGLLSSSSSPSLYYAMLICQSPNSSSTRNPNIIEDKFGINSREKNGIFKYEQSYKGHKV
jgi:hypothetical protein